MPPLMVHISMKGQREIEAKLRKVGSDVQRKAMIAAPSGAALIVSNRAKKKAPVLTGTLRRSIHVGGMGRKNADFKPGTDITLYFELPGPDVGVKRVTVFVGTNLAYARIVEEGRGNRPAKPYLRPALDGNRRELTNEMADIIWDVIRVAL